jgi:hypothetical protein
LERIGELFVPEPNLPFLTAPPLIGVLLILAFMNRGRLGAMVPLTVAWIFVLSFPAGVSERLAFLQVGRNTFHLNAWICLPAASFVAVIWSSLGKFPRAVMSLSIGWYLLCTSLLPIDNLRMIFVEGIQMTTAEMFPKHRAILEELKRYSKDSRRVLFEVFEDRIAEMAGANNPYGSVRLSPLIPSQTGLEAIGGPYWATHYHTNFTNCGEGYFVGGKRWERREAEEYFRIYGLNLAVLWSRPALGFAETNRDLFELVKDLRVVKIFRLHRPKAAWEESGMQIAATYNQIVVDNPRRAAGRFVLPYHATPGWTAFPSCSVSSTFLAEDPVPFLTLNDPPEKVTLRFSPWTLGGPPPGR